LLTLEGVDGPQEVVDGVCAAALVDHMLRECREEAALLLLGKVSEGPPPALALELYARLLE